MPRDRTAAEYDDDDDDAPDPSDWTPDEDDDGSADEETCPRCAAAMYAGAGRCPRCGAWVTGTERRSHRRWVVVTAAVLLVAFVLLVLRGW